VLGWMLPEVGEAVGGCWDLRPEGFVGEFPFFLFGDLRPERSIVFVVTESTFFILFGAFVI
jgi:hypothetical protein